jgi:type I site-specific restriction-modification system R (restriction) subunit
VADDPEFDKVKALKKIRHYVESHDKAIRRKAEIMVDHFIAQVVGKQKIGGKARAMIVCNGVERAIDYWREVSDYLTQIKSPYKAIVAYSGDFEIGGQKKTEADLNGFQVRTFRQISSKTRIASSSLLTSLSPASMSPCCTLCMWTSHWRAFWRCRPCHV